MRTSICSRNARPASVIVSSSVIRSRRLSRSKPASMSSVFQPRLGTNERAGSPHHASVSSRISTASAPPTAHAITWLSPRCSRNRSAARHRSPSGWPGKPCDRRPPKIGRPVHGATSAARRSTSVTRPRPSGCSPSTRCNISVAPSLPSLEDGLPSGDLPTSLHSRHNHLRIEAAERGGDDFPRHATHARATTSEVRLRLRADSAVRAFDRTIETEGDIGRVSLRGDIHPASQRFQRVTQAASLPTKIQCHQISSP